jgi:DNA mismatch repair protein MutS2
VAIQTETLELLEWSRLCQQVSTFAATKLGKIAARHLVIPTTPDVSLNLLAQTKEVYQLETQLTGGLSLDGIEDFGDALERAAVHGMLSGRELHEIATTLAGMRKLRRTIDAAENIPVLQALVADVRTYPELEQDIYHCIDDRGDVTDRASDKLAEVRVKLKGLRDRIYQLLNSLLQRHANAIHQPLITQRGDRFVIPVKASHKDLIPGVVHDTSSSGSTLYVEPHNIINLGNQLRQLQRQEQREIELVLQALTLKVTEVHDDLEHLLAVATTIDLATARARYSLWLEANPPRLIDRSAGEYITLRQLRHPLLIWKQRHEEGHEVVPIDLSIRPDLRVVTITGPNTGGKTVTLKTLAIVALMAKVGLFIPAREPVEIPWFDLILADIGDEQSLQQSLSTFSGHIRRIGRILGEIEPPTAGEGDLVDGANSAVNPPPTPSQEGNLVDGANSESDELQENYEGESPLSEIESVGVPLVGTLETDANHSDPPQHNYPTALVLLDEVGAGTDPAEGSALAIALLQYLADRATLTIASTHYGELKALKYQDERFENASVEFDDVSLSPTYRLLWGIPGRSNALSIAQRLGLNPAVIENARSQVVLGATQEVNQVIAGLEAQRRKQEDKANEAAKILKQAEAFYLEVSQKAAQLQAREQELKVNQERAIQSAIVEAKGEIAQVIRHLQQGPQTAQSAQQATAELDRITGDRLPARSTPKPPPGFNPKVGDRIRIPKIGQKAEVLTAVDDNGNLNVKFGIMKMNVSLADIESLTGEKATIPEKKSAAKVQNHQKSPVTPTVPIVAIRTSANTVDIRGQRVANAEGEIERAIGKAYQSGIMWVIHGKGTGKLREGVHEFLNHHPQVARIELAGEKDGGGGVTIAYLK